MIRHIPLRASDCVPIDKETLKEELQLLVEGYPERQWEIESLHALQVWRQDDNGIAFKVGEPTSDRDAKCWVEHFTALGHKQVYWHSRV